VTDFFKCRESLQLNLLGLKLARLAIESSFDSAFGGAKIMSDGELPKLLICSDDHINSISLRVVLEKRGYDTASCNKENIKEEISAFKPDILVIYLSEASMFIEVFRQIGQGDEPQIQTILTIGAEDFVQEHEIYQKRCAKNFAKPLDLEALRRTLLLANANIGSV
jgi:DNA-binding NtrC family response regulator